MFERNPDFILQEGDQGLIISGQLFKVVPRTRRFSWLCRIYTAKNPLPQRQYLRLNPAQINQLILLGAAQEFRLKDRYTINRAFSHFDDGSIGRFLYHPIIGMNYELKHAQCFYNLVDRKISLEELSAPPDEGSIEAVSFFVFNYHLERGNLA